MSIFLLLKKPWEKGNIPSRPPPARRSLGEGGIRDPALSKVKIKILSKHAKHFLKLPKAVFKKSLIKFK
jgi:hypothetical protein